MRADNLFSKLDITLLSLMILGIEFYVDVQSYMKLFFMLLERGLGKRNVFELSRIGGYAAVIPFLSLIYMEPPLEQPQAL